MTSSKRTSRVFDTWDALYELLDRIPWTAHPATGLKPSAPEGHSVWFGDMNEDRTEAIVVTGVPVDSPSITQATMGASQSREEEFTLRVIVGTKVPGCSVRVARVRLAELCDAIQESLRSPVSGRQAGDFATDVPGVQWWRINRLVAQTYGMQEGYGGWAELDVLFHCYI